MKKLLMIAVCFLFIEANSFAEPMQEHTWEVGTEISRIKYEESVMNEKGIMYGLCGSYTYRKDYMLRAEGRCSFGEVDYDGQLSNGTPYTIDNIDDYILEFRGLIGYDFPTLEVVTLTPYIGMGYRYLNDDLSKDPAGYERESNYFYSPIGMEIFTLLGNGWIIGVTVEYDYLWKGIQKSHYSDFSSAFNDLENDQDSGYGLRGSVTLQKKLYEVDFVIEPFIRYWDIDRSDDATLTYAGAVWGYGYEPENESMEYGIKLTVKF